VPEQYRATAGLGSPERSRSPALRSRYAGRSRGPGRDGLHNRSSRALLGSTSSPQVGVPVPPRLSQAPVHGRQVRPWHTLRMDPSPQEILDPSLWKTEVCTARTGRSSFWKDAGCHGWLAEGPPTRMSRPPVRRSRALLPSPRLRRGCPCHPALPRPEYSAGPSAGACYSANPYGPAALVLRSEASSLRSRSGSFGGVGTSQSSKARAA
jgi:hypothetical protein